MATAYNERTRISIQNRCLQHDHNFCRTDLSDIFVLVLKKQANQPDML
jgi:hypothetical protein